MIKHTGETLYYQWAITHNFVWDALAADFNALVDQVEAKDKEIARLRVALEKQASIHGRYCQTVSLGRAHHCDCRARLAAAALAAPESAPATCRHEPLKREWEDSWYCNKCGENVAAPLNEPPASGREARPQVASRPEPEIMKAWDRLYACLVDLRDKKSGAGLNTATAIQTLIRAEIAADKERT